MKQSEQANPDGAVFNIFEDASDNSTNVFSGFFSKIGEKSELGFKT